MSTYINSHTIYIMNERVENFIKYPHRDDFTVISKGLHIGMIKIENFIYICISRYIKKYVRLLDSRV